MNKCNVCGCEGENVVAGRWIFYCPAHKQNDWQKTYDNEIAPQLSSEMPDMLDGEVLELMEQYI